MLPRPRTRGSTTSTSGAAPSRPHPRPPPPPPALRPRNPQGSWGACKIRLPRRTSWRLPLLCPGPPVSVLGGWWWWHCRAPCTCPLCLHACAPPGLQVGSPCLQNMCMYSAHTQAQNTCTHVYTHMHVHTRSRAHARAHTHTHTHTHTHNSHTYAGFRLAARFPDTPVQELTQQATVLSKWVRVLKPRAPWT